MHVCVTAPVSQVEWCHCGCLLVVTLLVRRGYRSLSPWKQKDALLLPPPQLSGWLCREDDSADVLQQPGIFQKMSLLDQVKCDCCDISKTRTTTCMQHHDLHWYLLTHFMVWTLEHISYVRSLEVMSVWMWKWNMVINILCFVPDVGYSMTSPEQKGVRMFRLQWDELEIFLPCFCLTLTVMFLFMEQTHL